MSRDWKPGDVAMVTVDYGKGARDVVCFRTPGWWRDSATGVSYGSALREVKAARPLLVIDPEDRRKVEALRDYLVGAYCDQNPGIVPPPSVALGNAMQTALRSLAAPPKPDEPQGLGAVVRDASDVLWTRIYSHGEGCNDWRRVDDFTSDEEADYRSEWRDLEAVEVLSEGVQS